MNTQEQLRPGAIFEGDTVVARLPDGDWLLVAPSHTFKRLEWGCYGERIGADGTGRENTDAMLAAGSPAAAYCRAALGKPYDLPSRGELAMLYQQRDLLGLEGLGWVWSSTENSSLGSWLQRFSDGVQSSGIKNSECWVVPVRRMFPPCATATEAASLREQRDELLAALEETLTAGINWYETATKSDASELGFVVRARAAIAKVKGGGQ